MAQVSLIWEKKMGSESDAILTGDFFVNYAFLSTTP